MRGKNLKFYVDILKKGGHWVWTVVKTGSLGVRFAKKGGHNTGRWYRPTYGSAPPPPGFYANLGDAGTRLPARKWHTRPGHNTQNLPGLVKTYGDVPPKRFGFLQETWAPFFLEKVPNNGSIFHANPGKFENLVCFWGKIARNGYFFPKNPYIWLPIFGKITHGHGHGCWAAGDMSPTKQNLTELRGGGDDSTELRRQVWRPGWTWTEFQII